MHSMHPPIFTSAVFVSPSSFGFAKDAKMELLTPEWTWNTMEIVFWQFLPQRQEIYLGAAA
jgi:hypothetical protein